MASFPALLRAAEAAELLPYVSERAPPPLDAFRREEGLVGGFSFAISDAIPGAVQSPSRQTWLAFAAFDHLTASPPTALNPAIKTVLQRRMRFLERFVRLSMTRQLDWQTTVEHQCGPLATRPSWHTPLAELMGDEWLRPLTQKALATLRWTHPRFLLEWHHDPIPDDFPAMLEQLLSGVAVDNSARWRQDPAVTADMAEDFKAERFRRLRPAKRHRIVEIGLAFHHGRISTSMLFSLVEVLERFGAAQRARHTSTAANACGEGIEFRLTALRFDGMCSMAGSAFEHLADLLQSSKDLHITDLKLPRLVDVEDRCLQRCLGDLIPSSRGRPRRLQRLTCLNDSHSFAVFGSLARHDASVAEIDLAYLAHDMDAFAAWLAFGFFHVDSRSSATSLCLRMPGLQATDELAPPYAVCTPHWIDTFKRVLRSVVSAEDLAPIDRKTASSGKRKRGRATGASPLEELSLPSDKLVFVEVKEDTKARKQPMNGSPIVAVLQTPDSDDDEEKQDHGRDDSDDHQTSMLWFQVIRKLRGWLAIVVPGAGAAWIPSTAVVSESLEETRLAKGDDRPILHNHRITSFAFAGGSLPLDEELRLQHADVLVQLLQAIGEPLQVLNLPYLTFSNGHVEQILRACPNLVELNLYSNDIDDISPLVAAYENDTSKITTLNIAEEGDIHDRIMKQTATILQLGIEDRARATVLRRLAMRFTPFDLNRIGYYLEEVFPAIHSALFKAPRLEYVRVHCADEDRHHLMRELDALRQRARSLPGAPTDEEAAAAARQSLPLPICNKAALLSVVRHSSLQQSALGSFDAGILSLIFELSRTCQTRLVHLAMDAPMF